MAYSSEALIKGIKPKKDAKDMATEEKETFLKTLEPNAMGFDNHEGMEMNEDRCP